MQFSQLQQLHLTVYLVFLAIAIKDKKMKQTEQSIFRIILLKSSDFSFRENQKSEY